MSYQNGVGLQIQMSCGYLKANGLIFLATPQVLMKLYSLNNFLRQTDGRESPIRSQLNTNAEGVSSSTTRYYNHPLHVITIIHYKLLQGMQVVEASLAAIAPRQCKWLLLEVYSHSTDTDVNLPEKTLLSKLITLYSEAENWYASQEILSVFVADYSKTQLLSFIPGLTKWRIEN